MRTARARTAALLLAAGTAWLAGVADAQTDLRPLLRRPPAGAAIPPAPPPGRWSLPQLQEAFTLADADADQQLTRLEAQQLAILPRSFEEMDQNKDGVLSRPEYEGRRG